MQTVHLLGSSVMTQRNHILCSTQQYFQKAYKSAVVIVVLIGKQSWTDAKQCVHRWIWYASCSHSNLGLRSLSICRVCEDPKVLAGILLAVNLQEPMAARLKKLLQSQTQPTMFQIHNRKGNAKRKEGTERHPGTHTELRPAPDGFFTISFSDIKRDSWISIILEGGEAFIWAHSELWNQVPELINPFRLHPEKEPAHVLWKKHLEKDNKVVYVVSPMGATYKWKTQHLFLFWIWYM